MIWGTPSRLPHGSLPYTHPHRSGAPRHRPFLVACPTSTPTPVRYTHRPTDSGACADVRAASGSLLLSRVVPGLLDPTPRWGEGSTHYSRLSTPPPAPSASVAARRTQSTHLRRPRDLPSSPGGPTRAGTLFTPRRGSGAPSPRQYREGSSAGRRAGRRELLSGHPSGVGREFRYHSPRGVVTDMSTRLRTPSHPLECSGPLRSESKCRRLVSGSHPPRTVGEGSPGRASKGPRSSS